MQIVSIEKIKDALKRSRLLDPDSDHLAIAAVAQSMGISEDLVREADEREECEA